MNGLQIYFLWLSSTLYSFRIVSYRTNVLLYRGALDIVEIITYCTGLTIATAYVLYKNNINLKRLLRATVLSVVIISLWYSWWPNYTYEQAFAIVAQDEEVTQLAVMGDPYFKQYRVNPAINNLYYFTAEFQGEIVLVFFHPKEGSYYLHKEVFGRPEIINR